MAESSRLGASELESELLALASEESGEKLFFQRLLDHCRERLDAASVAVYHPAGEGWRLEASRGPEAFPPRLGTKLDGLHAVEVTGGRLVYTGEVTPDPGELNPYLALLGSGLTISRLRRQVKEHRFQANYRGVELEALYDVGLAIASTLRSEDLYQEILLRAISLLDARRGALYLVRGGSYDRTGTFGGEALESFTPEAADSAGIEEWAMKGDLLPGAKHLLAVPVRIENRQLGLLVVADKESRRGVGPFAAGDRRTLLLFANQAAIALENARLHREALEKERLAHEMTLAAQIQDRILPKSRPELPGYSVAGWNRPAREVGGDYYQYFPDDDRLSFVVADVTGKGVPAALLVATLHSALGLLLDRFPVGRDLFQRLNRHILESSTENKFITLFLAQLQPASGQLSYLSAGHDPGLLVRAEGDLSYLSACGLPLGLMGDAEYATRSLRLDPGDLVFLYTDGYTESNSRAEEEFGLDRLGQIVREHRKEPLEALIERVDSTVRSFSEGLPQADDQTLLILRRES